jgi:hypothetical protein
MSGSVLWPGIAVAVSLLLGAPSIAQAQDGSVRFTVTKAGFIVGAGGGTGSLYTRGRFYPLRVSGVSLGTIGLATAHFQGKVYNLKTAADIVGRYKAISGGVAFGAGVKGAQVQNQKGVLLDLRGREVGVELSVSLSRLRIALR